MTVGNADGYPLGSTVDTDEGTPVGSALGILLGMAGE